MTTIQTLRHIETQIILVALLIVLVWVSILFILYIIRKEQIVQKHDFQQVKTRLTNIRDTIKGKKGKK